VRFRFMMDTVAPVGGRQFVDAAPVVGDSDSGADRTAIAIRKQLETSSECSQRLADAFDRATRVGTNGMRRQDLFVVSAGTRELTP